MRHSVEATSEIYHSKLMFISTFNDTRFKLCSRSKLIWWTWGCISQSNILSSSGLHCVHQLVARCVCPLFGAEQVSVEWVLRGLSAACCGLKTNCESKSKTVKLQPDSLTMSWNSLWSSAESSRAADSEGDPLSHTGDVIWTESPLYARREQGSVVICDVAPNWTYTSRIRTT